MSHLRHQAGLPATPPGTNDTSDREANVTNLELHKQFLTLQAVLDAAGARPRPRVHASDTSWLTRAVNACIKLVRDKGAVIFPDLDKQCRKLGLQTDGTESMVMADRPHVVWWGGASTTFLDVIDAMLVQEPRIRMIRTTADCYRKRKPSGVLIFRSAEMPVIEGEIAIQGYGSQHWAPMIFVWDESYSPRRPALHLV